MNRKDVDLLIENELKVLHRVRIELIGMNTVEVKMMLRTAKRESELRLDELRTKRERMAKVSESEVGGRADLHPHSEYLPSEGRSDEEGDILHLGASPGLG
jgi:hypothetical protein